jgi:hypothetical protein
MKMINTWQEWCSIFNSLDFWKEEINGICTANDIEIITISNAYPGTHAVFLVNDELVIKIYCPVKYNSYELELNLHQGILFDDPSFAQILCYGRSISGYDYIIFKKIHGNPIREINLQFVPHSAIQNLASVIVNLQRKTLQSPADGIKCLIHNDITEDHIYLNEKNELAGIIDWGDAAIEHPSSEFPVLFVDALKCDDILINTFIDFYNKSAGFYTINDADISSAILRHAFGNDIIKSINQSDSQFAQRIKQLLKNC